MAHSSKTLDYALVGRINANKGMLKKEKQIAKHVQRDPNGRTYTWQRLSTSPIVRGALAAGFAGGLAYGVKKVGPKTLRAVGNMQAKLMSMDPSKMPSVVNKWWNMLPETMRTVKLPGSVEQRIDTLAGRSIAYTAGTAGASSAAGKYLERYRHAKELQDQAQDPERAKLRKLAELTGLIDDAALLAARAYAEQSAKKSTVVENDKAPKVRKELLAIEKQAFPVDKVKQLVDKTKLGIGTITAGADKAIEHTVTAIAGPHMARAVADTAKSEVFGVQKAALGTAVLYGVGKQVGHDAQHAARYITRGAKMGFEDLRNTTTKAKPFLSRAKNEVQQMWAQAKQGPK